MKEQPLVFSVILTLTLGFMLAGCGGGGNSTDDQAAVTAQAGIETDPPKIQLPPPAKDPEKAKKIQELVAKLRSSDEREAYDAVLKLGMMGDETAADELYEVARYHRNEYMRQGALKALANTGDQRAVSMVLDDLRSRDLTERRNAAASLGNFRKNEEVIEPLIEALRDDDGWVRMNAQGSLEKVTRQRHVTYEAWRDWYRARQSSR